MKWKRRICGFAGFAGAGEKVERQELHQRGIFTSAIEET
jgi:hypothetical protein